MKRGVVFFKTSEHCKQAIEQVNGVLQVIYLYTHTHTQQQQPYPARIYTNTHIHIMGLIASYTTAHFKDPTFGQGKNSNPLQYHHICLQVPHQTW